MPLLYQYDTENTTNIFADIVLHWTLRDASDPIVRNGYLYDITHNRTLTLLIPIVTSSHAGEYVMTHTLVRHPQKCQLQVRQGVYMLFIFLTDFLIMLTIFYLYLCFITTLNKCSFTIQQQHIIFIIMLKDFTITIDN